MCPVDSRHDDLKRNKLITLNLQSSLMKEIHDNCKMKRENPLFYVCSFVLNGFILFQSVR